MFLKLNAKLNGEACYHKEGQVLRSGNLQRRIVNVDKRINDALAG